MLGLKGVSRPAGGIVGGLFTMVGVQVTLATLSTGVLLLIAGLTKDWLASFLNAVGITIGITTFISLFIQMIGHRLEYALESVSLLEHRQILRLENGGRRVVYVHSARIKARQNGVCDYRMRLKWHGDGRMIHYSPLHGIEKYTLTFDSEAGLFLFDFLPLRKHQYKDLGVTVIIDEPDRSYKNFIAFTTVGLFSYLANVIMELSWDESIDLDGGLAHVTAFRTPQDDDYRNKPPMKVYSDLKQDAPSRRLSWTVRNPKANHKYKLNFIPPWMNDRPEMGTTEDPPTVVVVHADEPRETGEGSADVSTAQRMAGRLQVWRQHCGLK